MLIDVVHDATITSLPDDGVVTVDAAALAKKSPGNIVYFSDRYVSGDVETPVHTFVLNKALLLPKGTTTVWRGPAAHSVRLQSLGAAGTAAVGLAGACHRVEFRNLVFHGMGVALEHECDRGVLIRDCEFVGLKQDFAIRGHLEGIQGADDVTIQRCAFRECGVDRGFVFWTLLDTNSLNAVARSRGVGAVWMPRLSTRWRIEKCIFSGGRGVPLTIDGDDAYIVDSDFEALKSDIDDLQSFVEVRSRTSVHMNRIRFGNEPFAPTTSMRVAPFLWEKSVEDVTVRAVQGSGRTSASAFFPALGSMAVIELATSVNGLRVSDLSLESSVTGGIRLLDSPVGASTAGTQSGTLSGAQNMARRFRTAMSRDATRWFMGPNDVGTQDLAASLTTPLPRWGGNFDILDEWAESSLFRTIDRTRPSRNWLRGSEVLPPPSSPLSSDWDVSPFVPKIFTSDADSLSPWPNLRALHFGSTTPFMVAQTLALTAESPAGSSGDSVTAGPLMTLSAWAAIPVSVSIELSVVVSGKTIARTAAGGIGMPARYWLCFESPGSVEFEVRFQFLRSGVPSAVATTLGIYGWFMWPQLEANAGPLAYRRSPPGKAGAAWPGESWSVGPIGVREGCPDEELQLGDRLVATITGQPPNRKASFFTDGSGNRWRSAVVASTELATALFLTSRENEAPP